MPNTKHVDIAKYWYGKFIHKDGSVSNEHGDDGILILCDLGEPSCWACDRPLISPQELRDDRSIEDVWGSSYIKKHLERCHIVAESLGGKDEPNNLFLMCPLCHKESPNTTNTNAFFRFVYRKRSTHGNGHPNINEVKRMINDELLARSLPNLETLVSTLSGDALKEFIQAFDVKVNNGRIAINEDMKLYNMNNATHHFGERSSRESIIIVLVDYIVNEYKKCFIKCEWK